MNTITLMKRQIAFLLFFVVASASAQTTIIIVRHADRASLAADAPLSRAGFARAKELARVLADVNVSAIYATQFVRTQQTVAPLAKERNLQPVLIQTSDTYARDLIADINEHHTNQTVVVASHSDRIPQILRELGVASPPEITMTEYDDLFVFTAPKLLTLRYGAPAR
jgi:broad specificity phosphatase PhoE